GAEVSVLFTAGERRVRLEKGEAHFQVAKNPARPFIVSAGAVDVRAVGTAFNVKLGAAAVDVLVTEGKVSVLEQGGAPEPVYLTVNQSTTLPLVPAATAAPVVELAAPDVAAQLAWQPRLLDFSATPLRGIVEEFNRHNAPYRLAIADPALASVPVSASL